ncbi:MAG TPA: class I SAM-dependent methyltransferase [Acidimicrobiales bacterium]|nr:class I SAM-dependent methyltransferase [Acidimicrobiales bacterium]
MADAGDVFGHALRDWAGGGTEPEIFERDDGFTETGVGHELYVAGFAGWPSPERRAMRYVSGRVIDVGCAAGRVPLHLQQRGYDVVGLDASPLAARTARARGVTDVWCMSADALTTRIGSFDTIVLFGNNFGIFGTPARLRRVLTSWARRTPPGARILAESTNPYCGGAPTLTRGYYFRNRHRGLPPGQVRLRIHYRDSTTPWFTWLFVSRREMRTLLRGTGWHQSRVLGATPADPYVAVLEKDRLTRP